MRVRFEVDGETWVEEIDDAESAYERVMMQAMKSGDAVYASILDDPPSTVSNRLKVQPRLTRRRLLWMISVGLLLIAPGILMALTVFHLSP